MRPSPPARRARRLACAAIAIVLVTAACSSARSDASRPVRSTAPPAAPGVVTGGSAISWWTSTEGGSIAQQVYTESQAATLARRFDRILGLKTTFRPTASRPSCARRTPTSS